MQRSKKDNNNDLKIKSLEELAHLNLETLIQVRDQKTNGKRATLIFTGSRTVTGVLKLGVEASKLGLSQVAGVDMATGNKFLGEADD